MIRFTKFLFIMLLLALGASAQTVDVTRVHDPSMIKAGDAYYLFSTGYGVPMRRSTDLLKWEKVGQVFERTPDWALRMIPGAQLGMWAPDISYYNGRYHVYYAVSTFGSNRSVIGLATNKTLDLSSRDYKWIDEGLVIESKKIDDWNAIDPNLVLDEQNQPWLTFGSFWSGIKLVRLDASTGKRDPGDTRLLSIASRGGGPIEAPYIIRHDGYFYLFVSFDFCCRGKESTYKIMVGRSKGVTGPYIDRAGTPMMKGGGTLVLASYGHVRGPGHCAVLQEKTGESWLVHHFYDADNDGKPTLQVRPLLWAKDGWPLAGEPVPYGPALKDLSVAGRWDHFVDETKVGTIQLLANGHINQPDSKARWSIDGSVLKLTWPRADAPDGKWIDDCIVGRDGRWYVGRNQKGQLIRGLSENASAR
jgi:arabinan endo-1,5-alpha-L-arabinosidase